MIQIEKNVDLKPHNTMRLSQTAKFFGIASDHNQLTHLIDFANRNDLSVFVLGGGSNLILTDDIPGLVIKNQLKGKKVVEESDEHVLLEIGAGENWHQLVTYCVDQNWGGIENLALIPGTVGASPVQNIAAYGQNLSDVFVSLEAVEIATNKSTTFTKDSCQFGYRDSVFKHTHPGKYIITSVQLRLNKNPKLETSYYSTGGRYDSLQQELDQIAAAPYSIKDAYQAVINIRQRKLLDPATHPTVGSYFINPIITVDQLKTLRKTDPHIQYYPTTDLKYTADEPDSLDQNEYVKIPAGRLLENLGWRGKQIGNCFTHDQHALIISHNGKATGSEIISFADQIVADVAKNYDIKLSSEVVIV